MHFKAFLSLNAAILAAILFSSALINPPADAEDPAVQSCAPGAAAAVPAECSPASPDGPAAKLPSHRILVGACAGADLHVMHYEPSSPGAGILAATWCE